jgi:hypothetical protein
MSVQASVSRINWESEAEHAQHCTATLSTDVNEASLQAAIAAHVPDGVGRARAIIGYEELDSGRNEPLMKSLEPVWR